MIFAPDTLVGVRRFLYGGRFDAYLFSMIGKQFGRWTVISAPIQPPRGERKWLCRCTCGTQRYVLERSLRSDGSLSCGCMRKENTAKANGKDLIGQTFGELTVLSRSETAHNNGGIWWLCRCSCGETYECPGTLLVTGRRTHCSGNAHKRYNPISDITGQHFGQLTALYPTEKRDPKGYVIWHCRCDCGNEVDVTYNKLLYTNQVSCGCRKNAHQNTLRQYLTRVADTSVDRLKSRKIPTNNTTGHPGVYLIRGKYVAKISFQKKTYYLGAYDIIEDAVKAREAAQEQLFDTTASFYAKWKEKADADPAWAAENPIHIQVSRNESQEFSVILLPALK